MKLKLLLFTNKKIMKILSLINSSTLSSIGTHRIHYSQDISTSNIALD